MPHTAYPSERAGLRYTVTLPPDLDANLEQLRRDMQWRSMSSMVVFALYEWLDGRSVEAIGVGATRA